MKGNFSCTWNDLVVDIHQRLKIIEWLNRVNGGHEFRKHETVLF